MIKSVGIRRLRGVEEGMVEGLTPLAIFVGPNGSGKSTVLDALLIGANPNPADAIGQCVIRRTGVKQGARWLFWRGDGEQDGSTSTVASETNQIRQVDLSVERSVSETAGFTRIMVSARDTDATTSAQLDFKCQVDVGSGNAYTASSIYKKFDDVDRIKLVDPSFIAGLSPLHVLYSDAVVLGRRSEANAIIGGVVHGLSGLEILTEGDSPVVYLVYADHGVPAALSGDGVHALLRLALELSASAGGVVLFEEPEIHQHPGSLRQTARAMLAAVRRGTQVILTTHSLELIDS